MRNTASTRSSSARTDGRHLSSEGRTPTGGAPWLFELAVFRPDAAIARGAEALCYDTPITSGVIGYLSESDVVRVLRLIAELPPWEDPVTPPSKEAYDAFAKAHAEELEWLNGR